MIETVVVVLALSVLLVLAYGVLSRRLRRVERQRSALARLRSR